MAQSPQQILSLLSDLNLDRLAPSLTTLVRPSVRLIPSAVEEYIVAIGASKIGGVPDVPDGWQWPAMGDKPLSFIAQINLRDVASTTAAESVLPSKGILSFFYEADEQPWGYDPKDKSGWKVFHFSQDGGILTRALVPDEVIRLGQFETCAVEFANEWTIPDIASGVSALQDLSDAEFDAYYGLEERLCSQLGQPSCTHRLLGHPQHIQGEMQMECHLASNGIYCGDLTGYQSAKAQALAPGASDWRLLLQMDSAAAAGMSWGDVGRIYYWIREQDLAALNFDAVWLVLQCA